MINFVHMVKAPNLNGLGRRNIQPQQVQALQDVPWTPWMTRSEAVIEGTDPATGLPTYTPNINNIARIIEEEWTADLDTPRANVAWLDIELGLRRLWGPGRLTIYADLIQVVKQLLPGRVRRRLPLSIYNLTQGAFRQGLPPRYHEHAAIDPWVDVHSLSLYNHHKPIDGIDTAIELDKQTVDRTFAHFDASPKPRMAWVWGWSKGGYYVPLEKWKNYVTYIIDHLRPGDFVAWFGAAKIWPSDDDFAPKIEWLKGYLGV